jgi:hypothetical protein
VEIKLIQVTSKELKELFVKPTGENKKVILIKTIPHG